MAKFTSPLGEISGGYGNLIAYKVKTQNRVRSKPLEYHDANTEEQQNSRRRLIVVSRFYSKLKDTDIIEIWRLAAIPTPHDRYTLFRKTNTNVFLPNGRIGDFSKLQLSVGELPQALNMQIEMDEEDKVTLTWNNHLNHTTGRNDDTLEVIALYEHRQFSPFILEDVHAKRTDEKAVFHVSRIAGKTLHLYCYFATPDRDAFSNDTYFAVTFP